MMPQGRAAMQQLEGKAGAAAALGASARVAWSGAIARLALQLTRRVALSLQLRMQRLTLLLRIAQL